MQHPENPPFHASARLISPVILLPPLPDFDTDPDSPPSSGPRLQSQMYDAATNFPAPRKQNIACDACRSRKVRCHQIPGQDKVGCPQRSQTKNRPAHMSAVLALPSEKLSLHVSPRTALRLFAVPAPHWPMCAVPLGICVVCGHHRRLLSSNHSPNPSQIILFGNTMLCCPSTMGTGV